ncbi:pyridoxal phosphate-dependent aminotransferase [Xanthomonas campestris]|uniref:pyridoxal phosphate-dependent aminotransferase n=1 Tax=Xanthomonas campestris TaxID=339 RepID=UPI000E325B32|nr:pyridoxal phosphate-dependent aminotransferase [Xanthomonas campestris]MEA9487919.1 pyridoxal phosphate-dependent aminotransferase [Xanthomonas campestris]MEA9506279.1 pyridoxal phosphate-dependent aminotransferase [Xanthomonas campestris]MEA9573535.1 pyridoxal phosphate-dependent aminotransferase [Xanthomonas campestris]MEB2110220.1 pyridoxal phosphate-dependent aminotransferase [Xanthomonas campestris pv. campestris]RFF77312.1 pyridoxal phosphate-dependent aminotransferase [Xanthomonas ca
MHIALSRRRFLRDSALFAGAAGSALPLLASAAERSVAIVPATAGAMAPVMIGSNEFPDGPCAAAIKAITQIAPQGGRYLRELQMELMTTLAAELKLPVNHLMAYAGSTEPLDYTMLAFTSPSAALVTADPTYESGWRAASRNGAKLVKVPLRKDFSHDVQAMCAADTNAGVIYICNPNNPTGSVTARKDLDYALAHKPKGSILVVDEAYIHFAQSTRSVVDMVAAGEDVVVLRTFSKLYGMAGIRLGYAAARPDLLAKLMFYSVNSLPVTAAAAGLASLRDATLVPQRRARTAATRTDVIDFLTKQGYACTASESNCFMVDVKQPAASFKDAMATFGLFIGRSWPVWPTWSRITVGTPEEMARFKQAFVQVMAGKRGPLPLPDATASVQTPMDAFFRYA